MPRDVQLSVRTLPGGFEAAEIDGLRPTDAADEAVRAIVRNALWTHGVACLRFADGLDDDQARAVASMIALVQFLEDHAEAHAPRYAHGWRAHDVLMWDNATVQHKAGGDFPVGEPRRFWRYMIEGPRPVGVN